MKGHRLAVLTACACFVLLLAGGLVHATGSGLACPDWPLCHGEVFPTMEGGVLIEHGHRLIALSVALLTFVLAAIIWRNRNQAPEPMRRSLPWIATGAALLVIIQAVLGGITVLLRLPMATRTLHLAVSVAFFSVLLVLCVRTGSQTPIAAPAAARRFVGLTALFIYLEMILGALVRHTGSGLACLGLVQCSAEQGFWPKTGPAQLQMLHRFSALLVAVLVIASSVRISRALRQGATRPARLRLLASAPHGLVLLQIALGLASVKTFLAIPVVMAHLGIAVLLLADFILLYLSLSPRAPEAVLAPRWTSEDAKAQIT